MNLSEFKVIRCSRHQAWENVRGQPEIGFGVASYWLRKWGEFCQPITEWSKGKPKHDRSSIDKYIFGVTERCRSKNLSTCTTKIRMTIKEIICVFDSCISSTDYLTQLRLRLGRVNVSDETRQGKRKSLLFV